VRALAVFERGADGARLDSRDDGPRLSERTKKPSSTAAKGTSASTLSSIGMPPMWAIAATLTQQVPLEQKHPSICRYFRRKASCYCEQSACSG
jgi:hypothetical protein